MILELACDMCGPVEVHPIEDGVHHRADCPICGRFIKWVSKRDLGLEGRSVTSRPGLKAKVRHRILERDGNTCQDCGRRAPDVVLQIDHIIPVKVACHFDMYDALIEDEFNLQTLCEECNLGKGMRFNNRIVIQLMRHAIRLGIAQREANEP